MAQFQLLAGDDSFDKFASVVKLESSPEWTGQIVDHLNMYKQLELEENMGHGGDNVVSEQVSHPKASIYGKVWAPGAQIQQIG